MVSSFKEKCRVDAHRLDPMLMTAAPMTNMIAALHLQYLQSLPWVILVVAVLTLLILFTYPAQIRQISPAKRWVLPALRILAVWAVALSILRPVITRQRVST